MAGRIVQHRTCVRSHPIDAGNQPLANESTFQSAMRKKSRAPNGCPPELTEAGTNGTGGKDFRKQDLPSRGGELRERIETPDSMTRPEPAPGL